MTPRLRQMVGSGARAEEIHQAAIEAGMIDLRKYSAILLMEGLTTVEEVTSVVAIES
jgi:type II secretory ATPase GspE/PulE/Tfp pilus assembly ATPase PilB-like protein